MEYSEECPGNEDYEGDSESEAPKKKRCRTVNTSQGTFSSCFGLGSVLADLDITEARRDVYMTVAMFTAVLAFIRLLPRY
ncbi:hypothetical protein BsWGS_10519 [Bradybaena similaris]